MKKLMIITFAFCFMISCKSNEQNKASMEVMQDEEQMEEVVNPVLEVGCYGYNADENVIKFDVKEFEPEVIADLTYALREKDKNTGTFRGTLKEDKLIGTYTFNSEGMESTREVAFFVNEGALYEGYGEMDESGTKFKDQSTITYSTNMPLTKAGCN